MKKNVKWRRPPKYCHNNSLWFISKKCILTYLLLWTEFYCHLNFKSAKLFSEVSSCHICFNRTLKRALKIPLRRLLKAINKGFQLLKSNLKSQLLFKTISSTKIAYAECRLQFNLHCIYDGHLHAAGGRGGWWVYMHWRAQENK